MEGEVKTSAGNTQWTSSQSHFVQTPFTNIVAEGNKISSGFKKVQLNACAKALNERFKLNRTGDHVANHLKTLKKKYNMINYLRNLSAASWDEDQFIISLNHEHYTNHFVVKYGPSLVHLFDYICVVLYVLIMLQLLRCKK
jgi:hypothetical protein